MKPVLVVGSVAFDTLHNKQGTHPRILGGAATYASIASALFSDTRLVGVVGQDFPDSAIEMFRNKGVDIDGLEIQPGKTFHWEGRYTDDLTARTSLRTELNVFADFHPKVPEKFKSSPYVLLGNISPSLQLEVLDQVKSPKLVLADTMNFWIESELDGLKAVMKRIDVLVINEEEARQLSGKHHIRDVADALLGAGPSTVVIKRGEYGAMLFQGDKIFSAAGFPLRTVLDPTGAGDTFAGGMLGFLAKEDSTDFQKLKEAVVHGSVVASFCCEGVGTSKLAQVSSSDAEKRYQNFLAISAIH